MVNFSHSWISLRYDIASRWEELGVLLRAREIETNDAMPIQGHVTRELASGSGGSASLLPGGVY